MLTEVGVEEWPFIAATIGADFGSKLDGIRADLEVHHMQAWRLNKNSGAAGYVITKTATIKGTDTRALWIAYAAGTCFRGRAAMRDVAEFMATVAEGWGLKRMRIEGRVSAWGRVLPGFVEVEPGVLERVL